VSVEPDHLLRVMVLTEQRLLAQMVDLTLNHGGYLVPTAQDVSDAEAIIGAWHPHLAVVDMESTDEPVIRRFGRDHPGRACGFRCLPKRGAEILKRSSRPAPARW
jgi:hypothetical protein